MPPLCSKSLLFSGVLFPLVQTQLSGAITTYTFGDGLDLDGSTVVTNLFDGVPQGNVTYTGPRTNPPNDNLHQTAIVTDANNNYTQVPSGGSYNPYFVGRRYGNSQNDYRTTMTFDLNSFVLPTPPSGETYVLDSVELWLEISGTPTSTGGVEIFEGDYSTANIPSGAVGIGGRDFSTDPVANQRFYLFELSPSNLDINNPGTFSFTIISSTPSTEVRFGSDYLQPSSVSGTNFAQPAPFLRINVDTLAAVPEPSAVLLCGFSSLLLGLRQRRK